MWILPQSVVFLAPSYDPIFYALDYFEGRGIEIWTRTIQLASVLVCVDEHEVCFEGTCWSSRSDAFEWFGSVQDAPAELLLNILLLFTSLGHSNVFDQLINNNDNALQIKSALSHSGVSMANGDRKLKAEGFFQSSLAYLQNDVVKIASGTFHDVPHTLNILDRFTNTDVDWRRICNMVLISRPGFKSVSVWGLIAIFGLTTLVALLSINPRGELVVLHHVCNTVRGVIYLAGKGIFWLASLCRKILMWIKTWRCKQLPRKVASVRISNVPIQIRQ